MRIAVVVGGWHYPLHFFTALAEQSSGDVDLFCVGHRNPNLPIVRQEKRADLITAPGRLGELDRELYAEYATESDLCILGWSFWEAPNICGDWCYLNQWLEQYDFREYDAILSCHDDTYVRRRDLFSQLSGDWLILANGNAAVEPPGYVRGSFEFFKPELLEMLGGKIPLGELKLTREGRTDTPIDRQVLQIWNDTGVPLRDFLVQNSLTDRVKYLSPHYRVSPWIIECERGFLHRQAWVPQWRMDDGLAAYPA